MIQGIEGDKSDDDGDDDEWEDDDLNGINNNTESSDFS